MLINLLEFIRTVLLHSWQVDDGKRSDFGLDWLLLGITGPGFVSVSPGNIGLCVAKLLLY